MPYNTNKDPSEVHPIAYVWYDELIISRRDIPDPGTQTAVFSDGFESGNTSAWLQTAGREPGGTR